MQKPLSGIRRFLERFWTLFLFLWILCTSAPFPALQSAWAGNPSGVTMEVPATARIGDTIKAKVNIVGGSEGIWFSSTGLRYIRGYYDHYGYCGDPCLVGGVIKTDYTDCCYVCCCHSCVYSSGLELSGTWYGGPTWEFEVTGCGSATITPTYLGPSHEGPFTLKTYEIQVLDGVVADFEFSGVGCVDDRMTFTNKSCGGTSFEWDFGDGKTSSEKSPTHRYEEAGTYAVSLKAIGPHDSDTATKSVTVVAECGTINGFCLVAPRATPLPGTVVKAYSSGSSADASAVAGSTGYYKMKIKASESYGLTASHPGFSKKIGPNVKLKPGGTATWNVFMTPTDDPESIDSASLNGDQSNNVVDPVNPATGNFYSSHDLFTFPGVRRMDVRFRASYNSAAAQGNGPLGFGWTHTYHVRVTQNGDEATVHFGDGHQEFFRLISGTDRYKAFHCHPSIELSRIGTGGWKADIGDGLYWEFDAQGRLVRIHDLNNNAISLQHSTQLDQLTDTHGRVIRFFYTEGRLTRITSPLSASGDTVVFSYDVSGDLTGITDPQGRSWNFTYDGQHRLLTKTDRQGVLVLTNVYDSSGRVVEQRDADGHSTLLSYTDTTTGRKVDITTPSGHTYSHEYDGNFNLLGITDARGLRATFTPGPHGKPMSAIDKKGQSAAFETNALGLPTAATNRLGVSTQATYNDKHQATSIGDPFGRKTSAGYDGKGNMISIEDPNFNYTQFRVNARGQPEYISYPAYGGTWDLTYNADGTLKSVKDRYDQTTAYQYDSAGRVIQTDYPAGFGSQKQQYDAGGNILWQESPLGQRTSFTHDENNRVLSRTFEPTGARTTYEYDRHGRTKATTNPMGGKTTVTFDAAGNVTASEDPDGVVTNFTYDERGQLASVISASGRETKFGYDPNGNRIWMRNPLGHTWRWTYDAIGRRTSKQDPFGNVTRFERSEDRRLVRATQASGRQTDYHFDDGGRLSRMAAPGSDGVVFYRNPAGMLTRLQDERRNSWRYEYDYLGRLNRITDPAGKAERYEYDAMGRLTQTTRRNGDPIRYTRDLDGRLTSVTLPGGGSVAYSYQYDLNAGTSTTAVTDAMGTATEVFDRMNRIVSRTDVWGKTIAFAYTPAGRLKKVVYPGGKEVDYTYDGSGRLQKITDWRNNVTAFAYDGLDRVSAVVLPNGVRTVYGYDIRSDLVDVRHLRPDNSVMTGFVLQRDALGRIVQADRIGDAPAAAIGDAARSFAYDPANRVLTQTGGADPVTFLFDDNGNLTGKSAGTAVTTCAYDAFSRLMSVSNGTDTTAYAYDAAGRRISKTHNGTETRYHRVGNAVYAFSGGSGEIGSYHIYADSLLYSLDDGGAIRVYHADPRGSVAAVTDSSHDVIQTYDYGPYGTLRASSGTLLNNPFQYVGTWGVLTDENGLAFMQARYYDPGMGRFLTEDPLGAFPGPNLYAYTQGDPINRIDPAGLWEGVDMAEGPVDMSDSDESEPLAYTEKPDTKFRIDLDMLSLTPYSLNYPPFNSLPWDYRDAIVSHYAKQDPAKAQELEKIFQKYDEFEDYLQPGTLDFFYRNAPANKTPNCEGCTRSLTGHARTGEYDAGTTGLEHFELVHVGVGQQISENGAISYQHHATGILDKSTGKLIAIMDPIAKSNIAGVPIPKTGQQASFINDQQVYDFSNGIQQPAVWAGERSMMVTKGGVQIIPD